MREENCCPDTISGNLLNDSDMRKSLEEFLQHEILRNTGLVLELMPHPQFSELRVWYYIQTNRVVLYVPEPLSFSLEELKNKLFSICQKKELFSPTEDADSVEDVRQYFNKKN